MRYWLSVLNRLGIGSILFGWGTLLALKQFGVIAKDISTLPFLFTAFGVLLVIGGIYRLSAREKTA